MGLGDHQELHLNQHHLVLSKDQVLSVGGGPNGYSIDETLKYVKESIVNNLKWKT